MDILGSQNVMVFKNEVISLITIGSSKTRKVRSADYYVGVCDVDDDVY